MTITLKDIAESEKICEAATKGPWTVNEYCTNNIRVWTEKGGVEVDPKTNKVIRELKAEVGRISRIGDREFVAHARTMLPAALKLARKMYEILELYAHTACARAYQLINVGLVASELCGKCLPCKARRLVEQMEEPTP